MGKKDQRSKVEDRKKVPFPEASSLPTSHSYDTLLGERDPRLRKRRGVWYTPEPIVGWIVRAVDELLRREFGLARGLADSRARLLDPATGCGTFLDEVLWQAPGKKEFRGFEILEEPFRIARAKLGENIFWKNALEKRPEKAAADSVSVVLGNPPFKGHSENRSEAVRWLDSLLDDYKREPDGEKLRERNPKWLNDDYVKFIRFGQHCIELQGRGILAYINNNGFLENTTFRGMRFRLLEMFDTIFVLDLHGNAKKRETAPDGRRDENVFPIQQGVSVNLFVKSRPEARSETQRLKSRRPIAELYHADLFGAKAEKFRVLQNRSLEEIPWKRLQPTGPQYFFVPKNLSDEERYRRGFAIDELFRIGSVGIVTGKDALLIDSDEMVLARRMREHLTQTAGRSDRKKYDKEKIRTIAYRPFESRFIYHDPGLIERERKNVMRHFADGGNLGLVLSRQIKAFDRYDHVFLTREIFESCLVSNKTSEITYGFPLELISESDERTPNFEEAVVERIVDRTGLTFEMLDLFDYVYGVLHDPNYRKSYNEFLKLGFPRIPYPENAERFERSRNFGKALRQLHLLESPDLNDPVVQFEGHADPVVEKIVYENDRLRINGRDTFENIPESAWSFPLGGYQPVQKWIKARKGRTLSPQEIEHFRKMIAAIVLSTQLTI